MWSHHGSDPHGDHVDRASGARLRADPRSVGNAVEHGASRATGRPAGSAADGGQTAVDDGGNFPRPGLRQPLMSLGALSEAATLPIRYTLRRSANLLSHAAPNMVGNPAYDNDLEFGYTRFDGENEEVNPVSFDDSWVEEAWRTPARMPKRRSCCCLNGRVSSYIKAGQTSLKKGRLE